MYMCSTSSRYVYSANGSVFSTDYLINTSFAHALILVIKNSYYVDHSDAFCRDHCFLLCIHCKLAYALLKVFLRAVSQRND